MAQECTLRIPVLHQSHLSRGSKWKKTVIFQYVFQAYSATFWASKIGKEKVVVGIPFYCHAFKLMIPFMHGYHAFSHGAGECNSLGHVCVSIIAMFINDF